jgi:hypothetical protein
MKFDDLINYNRRNSDNYKNRSYQDEYRGSSYSANSNLSYNSKYKIQNILEKIRNNKTLKLFLITAAITLLIIIIALILILLPLLLKLLDYINQNGIQGILEFLTEFLNKLWQGSAT